MPDNNIKAKPTEKVEATPPAKKPIAESVYTADELADNHKVFKTTRDIVAVALRLAGKKTATLAEAKIIVEKFKNKEV